MTRQEEEPGNGKDDNKTTLFCVEGRGCNEWCSFTLQGTYHYVDQEETARLTLTKTYASSTSRRRRKRPWKDDDDDDELDHDNNETAQLNELVALQEEAHLSVEELRQRYYGNTAATDKDTTTPSSKRTKVASTKKKKKNDDNDDDDDDDDDAYGF